MKRMLLQLILGLLTCAAAAETPDDWSRFRGPNGSGVSDAGGLPTEFGPDKNLIWKTPLPSGHSSPILVGDLVLLTGYEDERLYTLALNRHDGGVLWRRQGPRTRQEKLDPRNNPASPTPVSDGESVFVFFPDYGLLAYDLKGEEIWRFALGPFNNVYGMGASPILVEDRLILVCDQSTDSFIIALRKSDGKMLWKEARPEAKSGHSTPILYRQPGEEPQILVPGSFFLTAYSPRTGEKLWWVGGLSFELKSTPVIDGDLLFINGYGSPFNQPGNQVALPSFDEVLQNQDVNGDGLLQPEEADEQPAKSWFGFVDLRGDGVLDAGDWSYFKAALASLNGLLAIRLGGQGDMTDENIVWTYRRSVPQLPSPLLYRGVLYMVNDGGIVTSLQPGSGEVIQRGRLREAVDKYYASPVAADGKVLMISETGKISVLKPDGSLEVVQVNDLGEEIYATPAIGAGRIYVRTVKALYCFGQRPAASGKRQAGSS